MDERLIALKRQVALAAEAWLTDPTNVRAYGRLVSVVRERRAYLQPPDVLPDDPDPGAPRRPERSTPGQSPPGAVPSPPAAHQPDALLDELTDQSPVQPLSTALVGRNPREILARLRGTPTDDTCP